MSHQFLHNWPLTEKQLGWEIKLGCFKLSFWVKLCFHLVLLQHVSLTLKSTLQSRIFKQTHNEARCFLSVVSYCLLLLSRVSWVRPCASPESTAYQAPPSLGFSRHEHWSGLPFPSPMHESEKWKWSHSVVSNTATPWTAAHQAPLSMGFSRQE